VSENIISYAEQEAVLACFEWRISLSEYESHRLLAMHGSPDMPVTKMTGITGGLEFDSRTDIRKDSGTQQTFYFLTPCMFSFLPEKYVITQFCLEIMMGRDPPITQL
jgi:hypothetical protein